jgi:hypothetical protein
MCGAVGEEDIERSTAAVEDAPYITLLEVVFLCSGGPLLDFLGYIFEGVFKDKIHLIVN